MNGLIGLCGTLALLLLVGGLIASISPKRFNVRWLLIAALLVAINDLLLTRGNGTFPHLFAESDWNWEGKLFALAATLVIGALPAFGWDRAGFTLRQRPGSLKTSIPVVAIYCLFFVAIAAFFPNDEVSGEDIAFQVTLPGLEEETFYRGILLIALDHAFVGRVRCFGADWGWGGLISCLLFGMAHAFGYSGASFSFDALTMALTVFPSLIALWLRSRTGSLLLPILMHNFGNSILLLL